MSRIGTDLSGETPVGIPGWLLAMDGVAEEDGYLERLGADHRAFFAETGPVLLVTFERAEEIRARDGNMPATWEIARANGWSLLTLIAEGETFWRAPEVWGFFDRLVDDAFFDDFDRVLFHGSGPAGYAAAAYMVAAPGAAALLVSPRATLEPAITGWDRRHLKARRLDFTSRYGYAPDMTEGASKLWLVHDPMSDMDAAHAALFRRPWVTMLPMRRTRERLDGLLASTGLGDILLKAAVEDDLDPALFARHWRRVRRNNATYLKALLNEVAALGRKRLEIGICRSVVARVRAPRFARRLQALTAPETPTETDGPGNG
ncbi:hypothetical protein [Pseudogemmobacter sonorensis]|uniref:hypothetical protein n=1 Tax=Pseudogemmobacter sonorensis TaxID=2989681 RepID=UPI0036830029